MPDQLLHAAQMPPPSNNDLPPAILARIFTLTHPRRDGLALLLTCRHWLAVAETECPQHLWDAVSLDAASPRLQQLRAQGTPGKQALWAGFAKRAPHDMHGSSNAEQLWRGLLRCTQLLELEVLEMRLPEQLPPGGCW